MMHIIVIHAETEMEADGLLLRLVYRIYCLIDYIDNLIIMDLFLCEGFFQIIYSMLTTVQLV